MLSYLIAIATSAGFFMLLALCLNLQWGMAGMLNFGIAGLYGLGAYTGALAVERLGLPFELALALATLVGAAAGAAVACLSLRLEGDFLAIVTLGFAELVRLVLLNEDWLTRGPRGLSLASRPYSGALDRDAYALAYLLAVAFAVGLTFFLVERLRTAPFGRVLRAIREDPLVPASLGKNVLWFRLRAFTLGSAAMGATGALYAFYVQTITPDHFTTSVALVVWMSVIIGGAGNNRGILVGAGLVMLFLEGTRFLGNITPWLDAERLSAIRMILVGTLLIVTLRFRPRGLLPEPRLRSKDLLPPKPALSKEIAS